MSRDFIIVNKKSCKLKLQQVYQSLSVLGEGKKAQKLCDPITLEKNGEVKLKEEMKYDQTYERLLIVTPINSPSQDTLTHSLVGFPNDEKIFIIPTSTSPFMDLIPSHAYELHLMLAGADNSHEALQLIHEKKDDDLLKMTHELKDICLTHFGFHYKNSPFSTEKLLASLPPPPTISKPLFSISGNTFASLLPHQTKYGKTIPASEIPIRIRRGVEDGLHEKEKLAREARLANISKKLGPNPLHIAMCTSGGGMRAMLSSCGFFTAMKEIGVMDISLYQCALSGSTWSTSKWMNTEENPFVQYDGVKAIDPWSCDISHENLPPPNIDKLLALATSDIFSWDNFKKYLPLLIQSRSFLLVYSQMLGEKMQETGTNYEKWQAKTLSGKFPIAVCTSVFKQHDPQLPFPVVDHTSFEIGSTFLSSYFPTEFYQLENFKHTLPMGLNNFMAIWGSAFYANLSEIIKDLPPIINKKIGGISADGAKVINANYNRKDPVTGELLPLANQQYLYYRDGGVLANLPIGPMLRPERTVDLIVVLDASASVSKLPFNELIKAVPAIKPAIPKKYTFPYVFSKTKDYPTIVYIPVLKDDTYDKHFDPAHCGSFEFTYPKEQAIKLHGLVHHTVVKAKDIIWQTINALQKEKDQATVTPQSTQSSPTTTVQFTPATKLDQPSSPMETTKSSSKSIFGKLKKPSDSKKVAK